MSLEDAGCCQKGEIGAFYDSVDTTDQGSFPVNTDGGQISAGQPMGGAGGFRQVIEAARQVMGRAALEGGENHHGDRIQQASSQTLEP